MASPIANQLSHLNLEAVQPPLKRQRLKPSAAPFNPPPLDLGEAYKGDFVFSGSIFQGGDAIDPALKAIQGTDRQ